MASADNDRLFFACWPEAPLRHTIYKATRRVVKASGGKPVPPENFHITLAFLGSLDPDAAGAVRRAAAGVRGSRFDLMLDRVGFWPQPRVVWLGASRVPTAARQLVDQLGTALRDCEIALQARPFQPHVTLARKVSKPGEFAPLTPIQWPATAFVLVRSASRAAGSEYSVLEEWPLAARRAQSVE